MSVKFATLAVSILVATSMIAAPAFARGGSKSHGTTVNVGNGGTAKGDGAKAKGGNDNYVDNAGKAGRGAKINVGNGGKAEGKNSNASGGNGNSVTF
jgi:hypothetical protein